MMASMTVIAMEASSTQVLPYGPYSNLLKGGLHRELYRGTRSLVYGSYRANVK